MSIFFSFSFYAKQLLLQNMYFGNATLMYSSYPIFDKMFQCIQQIFRQNYQVSDRNP